jgi:hypothetical protein
MQLLQRPRVLVNGSLRQLARTPCQSWTRRSSPRASTNEFRYLVRNCSKTCAESSRFKDSSSLPKSSTEARQLAPSSTSWRGPLHPHLFTPDTTSSLSSYYLCTMNGRRLSVSFPSVSPRITRPFSSGGLARLDWRVLERRTRE